MYIWETTTAIVAPNWFGEATRVTSHRIIFVWVATQQFQNWLVVFCDLVGNQKLWINVRQRNENCYSCIAINRILYVYRSKSSNGFLGLDIFRPGTIMRSPSAHVSEALVAAQTTRKIRILRKTTVDLLRDHLFWVFKKNNSFVKRIFTLSGTMAVKRVEQIW